jgi:hypothetical protein
VYKFDTLSEIQHITQDVPFTCAVVYRSHI